MTPTLHLAFPTVLVLLTAICDSSVSLAVDKTTTDAALESLSVAKMTQTGQDCVLENSPAPVQTSNAVDPDVVERVWIEGQLSYFDTSTPVFFLQGNGRAYKFRKNGLSRRVLKNVALGTTVSIEAEIGRGGNRLKPIKIDIENQQRPMVPIDSGIGIGATRAPGGSFVSIRGRIQAAYLDYPRQLTELLFICNGVGTILRIPDTVSEDLLESWIGASVSATGVLSVSRRTSLPDVKQMVLLMTADQLQIESERDLMGNVQFPLMHYVGRLVYKESTTHGVLMLQRSDDAVLFSSPFAGEFNIAERIGVRGSRVTDMPKDLKSCRAYILIRLPSFSIGSTPHQKQNAMKNKLLQISGSVEALSHGANAYDLLISTNHCLVHATIPTMGSRMEMDVPEIEVHDTVSIRGVPFQRNSNQVVQTLSNGTLQGKVGQTLFVPSMNEVTLISRPFYLTRQTLQLAIMTLGIVSALAIVWMKTLRNEVESRTQGLMRVTSEIQTAFDTVREGILIGVSGKPGTRANKRFHDIFGFMPPEGSSIDRCLDQIESRLIDPSGFARLRRCNLRHNGCAGEFQMVNPTRTIQVYCNPIENTDVESLTTAKTASGSDENHAGPILWAFQDMTQQRLLEDNLMQSQKMEVVGRLSSGVAHDVNNLLTVMRASTTMITRRSQQQMPELQQFLQRAEKAIDRASDLINQLLNFSRRNKLTLRPTDLNEIVRSACELISTGIPESIQVLLKLNDLPMIADLDRARMEQVIVNLLLNARDSMSKSGGTITAATYVDVNPFSPASSMPAERMAVIEVRDTGVGMDDHLISRVFDPFFTTKQLGMGTGLGLSMARDIIQRHGGSIKCQSKPDEGTEFRILLPLMAQQNSTIDFELEKRNQRDRTTTI